MKQYTLLELCSCIDEALSMELNDTYWVRAEIASLTERGHCYMELVEKAKNNAIAAKLHAGFVAGGGQFSCRLWVESECCGH